MKPSTEAQSAAPAPSITVGRHRLSQLPVELSIIVPTRNEFGNVRPLVELIRSALTDVPAEVVFVDDSDDRTPEAIMDLGDRENLDIRLIHREPGRRGGGLSGAVVAGIRAARSPWICVMDADLQHPPATISRMLVNARAEKSDLVIASRYCDGGSPGAFGRARLWLSRASARSGQIAFPRRLQAVSDPMSGFFLVRRAALNLDALQPRGFKILLEIVIRTPGLRISEVPFTFGERHAGATKASFREGLRFLAHLWHLRMGQLATRLGRFGVVGATGLAVNTALLALLVEPGGLNYVLAAILASQGSTLWNFTLTETWVFRRPPAVGTATRRMAMFFVMNNVANLLRIPMLVALTSGLGINYLISNVVTLAAVFVGRFAISDSWIWAGAGGPGQAQTTWNYDIHGIVSVCSDGRLPELERFRISEEFDDPTIRVRLGELPELEGKDPADRILYTEVRSLGFGMCLHVGERSDIVASRWLERSPHVLYTNVVEPVLRWTFVRKGYALVHAACLSANGRAFLITARTDTGKTTTILKILDAHPYMFLSDDLTIISPDGRVLTYPKPLTISRHTLGAVKTPLLRRRERLGLFLQSRIHSRSGRVFALVLAKTRIPAATLNAIVQWIVPPPKYHVERLVPGVTIAPEAQLAGMAVIQRGGKGDDRLDPDEALETLMGNCEDAYGFPPYPAIKEFLHSGNGRNLKVEEREIVSSALLGVPAVVMRSETMDWSERLPALLPDAMHGNGNGKAHRFAPSGADALGKAEATFEQIGPGSTSSGA
jgi:dolichol-phosphate mannosyltransferase